MIIYRTTILIVTVILVSIIARSTISFAGDGIKAHGCIEMLETLRSSAQDFQVFDSPPLKVSNDEGEEEVCFGNDEFKMLVAQLDPHQPLCKTCFRGRVGPDKVPAVLFADGPYGSGRFWVISFLYRDTNDQLRGFCSSEFTAGWRNIEPLHQDLAPLEWMRDVDGDGTMEFICWVSVAINSDPSLASYLLAPLVYSLQGEVVQIDLEKGQQYLLEISELYNNQAKVNNDVDSPKSTYLGGYYTKFSKALKAYALATDCLEEESN